MTRNHSDETARLLHDTERRLAEQIRLTAELEDSLKEMELRALQAQINPHFLFNTLSSIAASSFMEDAPKTHELVQALARLLRYTLRQIGQMVELEEELKHVKDYLLIAEARFGDRIRFEFDIDPRSLRARLPLLTLQPLVENAIIHGLEPKAGGTLRVSSRLQGDWVRIEVTDDGVGLDDDAVAVQGSADPDRSRVSHVTGLGLDNVRRRLEHAFGEGADLDIRSRRGEGTVVTVTIPGRSPGPTGEGERA